MCNYTVEGYRPERTNPHVCLLCAWVDNSCVASLFINGGGLEMAADQWIAHSLHSSAVAGTTFSSDPLLSVIWFGTNVNPWCRVKWVERTPRCLHNSNNYNFYIIFNFLHMLIATQ